MLAICGWRDKYAGRETSDLIRLKRGTINDTTYSAAQKHEDTPELEKMIRSGLKDEA